MLKSADMESDHEVENGRRHFQISHDPINQVYEHLLLQINQDRIESELGYDHSLSDKKNPIMHHVELLYIQ